MHTKAGGSDLQIAGNDCKISDQRAKRQVQNPLLITGCSIKDALQSPQIEREPQQGQAKRHALSALVLAFTKQCVKRNFAKHKENHEGNGNVNAVEHFMTFAIGKQQDKREKDQRKNNNRANARIFWGLHDCASPAADLPYLMLLASRQWF